MGIIAEASLPTRRMDFENTRLPPEADAPRTRNAVFNGERLKLFFINTWREPDMNPKSMVINSALSVPDVPFVVLEAEKYLTAVTSGCAFQDKPTTRRFAANKFFDFADLRRCGHRTRHDENGCGRRMSLTLFIILSSSAQWKEARCSLACRVSGRSAPRKPSRSPWE